MKTGQQWAELVNDNEFAKYLINKYADKLISGDEYEAICRGYYAC